MAKLLPLEPDRGHTLPRGSSGGVPFTRHGDFKAAAIPEDCYRAIATEVEYPAVEVCSASEDWAALEPCR